MFLRAKRMITFQEQPSSCKHHRRRSSSFPSIVFLCDGAMTETSEVAAGNEVQSRYFQMLSLHLRRVKVVEPICSKKNVCLHLASVSSNATVRTIDALVGGPPCSLHLSKSLERPMKVFQR